jgi:hypothetical protein
MEDINSNLESLKAKLIQIEANIKEISREAAKLIKTRESILEKQRLAFVKDEISCKKKVDDILSLKR